MKLQTPAYLLLLAGMSLAATESDTTTSIPLTSSVSHAQEDPVDSAEGVLGLTLQALLFTMGLTLSQDATSSAIPTSPPRAYPQEPYVQAQPPAVPAAQDNGLPQQNNAVSVVTVYVTPEGQQVRPTVTISVPAAYGQDKPEGQGVGGVNAAGAPQEQAQPNSPPYNPPTPPQPHQAPSFLEGIFGDIL